MTPREEYWILTRDLESGKVVRMERIPEPVHVEALEPDRECAA